MVVKSPGKVPGRGGVSTGDQGKTGSAPQHMHKDVRLCLSLEKSLVDRGKAGGAHDTCMEMFDCVRDQGGFSNGSNDLLPSKARGEPDIGYNCCCLWVSV